TAVMITYNRREEVLRSLDKISALPEQPSIILVDNGSIDGTFDAVGARFPHVERVRGSRNLGAAARNLGVKRARTPYVALCDDDTWWAPGNLTRAADLLDAYAHVAVLTARLLNGPDEVEDAICRTLATSPVRGRE